MGLSQSCLGATKAQEFKDPTKVRAQEFGKEERAAATEPSGSRRAAVAAAEACAQKTASTCNGTCPRKESVGTSVSSKTPSLLNADAIHGSPDAAAGLETNQLSGAFAATATTSLQSTFTSFEGYPHSAWDLGPSTTDDEQARVQALRALDILDCVSQGRQIRMDEEANMVLGALMQMFNAITAMLVLFDDTRIIIRNAMGVLKAGEFPYRWSFCAYTLTKHRPQTLVVPDATQDARFADNPFVRGEPHVRFYCGAPLVSASGHILGTLCFADNKPRPSFDTSQCYLINNMAELMVRHLERYRANAGPAGPNDAETTALTRVARTIECYESTTGLVDISLSQGWMLMYVNEAWEAMCSPWSRKQMLGRPLQQLLILEEEQEEQPHLEPEPEPPPLMSGTDTKRRASGGGSVVATVSSPPAKLQGLAKAPSVGYKRAAAAGIPQDAGVAVGRSGSGTSTSVSVSGAFGGEQCQSCGQCSASESAALAGAVEGAAGQEPSLMAMPGPERRAWRQRQERQAVVAAAVWQRHAGALRAGEEVDLGRARVLLVDGQPSHTVVRLTARSANCHVLDAAVRMPVGVPHQQGLPNSILAAARDAGKISESGTPDGAATAADRGGVKPEPCYCIITLVKIGEDGLDGGERPAAPAAAAAPSGRGSATDTSAYVADLGSPAPRPSFSRAPAGVMSQCGGRPSLDNSGVLGSGGGRSRRLAVMAAAAGASASLVARGSSMRSSASCGVGNWAYGMEPIPGLKLWHLLGKGGYGKVFAASYKGQKVAAKVISNSMLKSATCVNGVTLEALLTQEIEHPYIVRTYKCVVRSYQPPEWPSFAIGTSVRGSAQHVGGHATPLDRSTANAVGAAAAVGTFPAAYRSVGSLPPAMSSMLSALPGFPSDVLDVARTASVASQLAEAGQPSAAANTVPDAMDATATATITPGLAGAPTKPGGCALAASGLPKAVAGAMEVGQTAQAVSAPPAVVASAAPRAVAAAAAQDMEFDSFDVGAEEEVGGGMIDQLTSAGPPVYVPQSAAAASAAVATTVGTPPLPLPLHVISAATDRLSVAASGGLAQSGAAAALTHGSVLSTAGAASVDQVVAALTARQARAPPRVPPGVNGPADLVSPGAAGGASACASVFSTAAAAGADVSLRHSARAATESLPEGETWLLQEYCGGGTLQEAIDTGRLRTEPSRLRGSPHMPYILLTAQEIAAAMACVHSRGYMHGDLSAVNVLLTDAASPVAGGGEGPGSGRGWVAKVSDFGLAKHLPDPSQPYVSSAYGVITHCAPEVLKSHAQTQKADVYSFGVLLWQMFTGSRPWANMNRFQIFGALTSGTSPGLRFLPTQQPPAAYRDLTMHCLSPNPACRPSFAEVCEELRVMTYEAAAAGQLQ